MAQHRKKPKEGTHKTILYTLKQTIPCCLEAQWTGSTQESTEECGDDDNGQLKVKRTCVTTVCFGPLFEFKFLPKIVL